MTNAIKLLLQRQSVFLQLESTIYKYRSIYINDCPIAVGVENPHKFWMCRNLATLDKLGDRVETDFHYRQYRHLSAILVSLML
jgi:hypothetical protein